MATRNGSPRRSGGSRGAVARAAAAAAALLVAAAVVAVAPAAAQSHRFPDVAPDHYAFEAVEWAAQVAVTNGYTDGTFKPEQPLIKRHAVVFMERYYDEILQADESADFTRGDMMVLLKAINDGTLRGTDTPGDPAPGTTGADQSHRFPDVAPDHYAFKAVEWAAQVAVTNGYTDGTFKPEQPLIKRHAVVFMERYYDEILQADESADFTRGDMMVLLKAINDSALRSTNTGAFKAVTPASPTLARSEPTTPSPAGDRTSPESATHQQAPTAPSPPPTTSLARYAPTTPSHAGETTTTDRPTHQQAPTKPSPPAISTPARYEPTTPSHAGETTTTDKRTRQRAPTKPSPPAVSTPARYGPTTPSHAGEGTWTGRATPRRAPTKR